MINFQLNECKISILPIIKGLISESEKVSAAIPGHECIAIALGVEDVEAFRDMDDQECEYDPSNLDAVYAHHLKTFGEVTVPIPAFKTAVEVANASNIPIIPLDMCDEDFTKMYCECVGTMDFLKEKRILKKSMKMKFDSENPEIFVKQWDDLINQLKGHKAVSLRREEYMASQIQDLSNYKKDILVIVEAERVQGIMIELGVE